MTAGISLLSGRYLWTARRRPVRTGTQAMLGLPAEILDWSDRAGHVMAQGERWQAQSEETFTAGERAEIASVKGLTLIVRRNQTQSSGELP